MVDYLHYEGALADWVAVWVVEHYNDLLQGVTQQQRLCTQQTERKSRVASKACHTVAEI
jgi:hypothetical protein